MSSDEVCWFVLINSLKYSQLLWSRQPITNLVLLAISLLICLQCTEIATHGLRKQFFPVDCSGTNLSLEIMGSWGKNNLTFFQDLKQVFEKESTTVYWVIFESCFAHASRDIVLKYQPNDPFKIIVSLQDRANWV